MVTLNWFFLWGHLWFNHISFSCVRPRDHCCPFSAVKSLGKLQNSQGPGQESFLAGRTWYLVMFTAQPATAPPNMDVAVTPHSWSRELTWALSRAIPWAFTRVWSCVHHFNSLHKLALTFPAHMRDALGIITKLVLTVAHFSNNPLKIHQLYKVFMNLKALECTFKVKALLLDLDRPRLES